MAALATPPHGWIRQNPVRGRLRVARSALRLNPFGERCETGGVCAVIDPCGGPVPCFDGDCPDVCEPLWGCVEPTPEGEACTYDQGLCEAGTRCRPVNDECELVDCNPNTGSCAQSCETLELACQPILEAASVMNWCRRGEICKEELTGMRSRSTLVRRELAHTAPLKKCLMSNPV